MRFSLQIQMHIACIKLFTHFHGRTPPMRGSCGVLLRKSNHSAHCAKRLQDSALQGGLHNSIVQSQTIAQSLLRCAKPPAPRHHTKQLFCPLSEAHAMCGLDSAVQVAEGVRSARYPTCVRRSIAPGIRCAITQGNASRRSITQNRSPACGMTHPAPAALPPHPSPADHAWTP